MPLFVRQKNSDEELRPPTRRHSFRSRKIERPRVIRAGEESDELFVGRASDPVIHAAVFGAEVGGPLEENDLAGLPAFHFDRVFVGASAIAFKRRLPDAVFLFDRGREVLAEVFGRTAALRRVVGRPDAGPGASDIGCRVFRLGALGLGESNANSQKQRGQDKPGAISHELLFLSGRVAAVEKRLFEN